MRRSEVGWKSRAIDAASMALISVGAALYIFSWVRLEELRTRPHQEFVPFETVAFGRTAEHTNLSRLSRVGLAIAGIGVIVGVSAAAHAYVTARRRTDINA